MFRMEIAMLERSENKPKELKNNPALQASRIFRGSISYRTTPQKHMHLRKLFKCAETVGTSVKLTDQDWEILESVLEDESGPSDSLRDDMQWFKKNFS
jgi:hypothetical protein